MSNFLRRWHQSSHDSKRLSHVTCRWAIAPNKYHPSHHESSNQGQWRDLCTTSLRKLSHQARFEYLCHLSESYSYHLAPMLVKLLCSTEIVRFNYATFHSRSIHLTTGPLKKAKDLWATNLKRVFTASPPYQAAQERIVKDSAPIMNGQLCISVVELSPNLRRYQICPA